MAIFGDIQERLLSRVARGVSSEGAEIKVLQPFEVDDVAGGMRRDDSFYKFRQCSGGADGSETCSDTAFYKSV